MPAAPSNVSFPLVLICISFENEANGLFRRCGGNVGIFINIRKCTVLFKHELHGTWTVAPYLDSYGETDPTLRRHHQLFLHQKRYDKLLREVWLNHGIPSTIARRLEGEVNNGGWETL
jgi:E3 ubiquitin-protein ligase UBR1